MSGKKRSSGGMSRREFIKTVGVVGGLAALGDVSGLTSLASAEEEREIFAPLPKRQLGNMGFEASILGMGGIYVNGGEVEEGVAILNRAFELGINYFDTASQYGDGESERRHGVWLQRLVAEGRRDEVFVATKTLSRSYDEASIEIENSLERLGIDYVDLLQVHAVNDMGTWNAVSGENGSLRAIENAKNDGRVRHIGITNHKDPAVLLQTLEEYPFESVLMPLGITDKLNRPFVEDALPELVERGVSVVAMKVFAAGQVAVAGADLERCLHYTFSLPLSTAVVGMKSVQEVEQNVGWLHTFEGFSEEEAEALGVEVGELLDVGSLWWKR